MATHPIVVIDNGIVHIRAGLRSDPRFQDGATLVLVPVQPSDVAGPSREGPRGDWRRLRGLYKSLDIDRNNELNQDRLTELATGERKLNGRESAR